MAKLATDKNLAKLTELYRDAESRLGVIIEETAARGAFGSATYRRRQLESVQAILAELQARGTAAATELVGVNYALGARAAEALTGLPATSFAGVHQEAVNVLADNLTDKLGAATINIGRQVDDIFRLEGLTAAAQGLTLGATRKEVSAALVATLEGSGVSAFVDRAGRSWGLERYAEMVARTTTREAVSHGTANRLLEEGKDLITVSEHTHDEDECSDYEGRTFSLTGETEGYDQIDALPPFHPNCVHVIMPAAAGFDAMEAALAKASTLEEAEAAVGVGAEPLPMPEAVANAIQATGQVEATAAVVPGVGELVAQAGVQEAVAAIAGRIEELKVGMVDREAVKVYGAGATDLESAMESLRRAGLPEETLERLEAQIKRQAHLEPEEMIEVGGMIRKRADELSGAAASERKVAALRGRIEEVATRSLDAAVEGDTVLSERLSAELGPLWDEVNRLEEELFELQREGVLKLLEGLRDMGGDLETLGLTPSSFTRGLRKTLDNVLDELRFLPREWLELSRDFKDKLRLVYSRGRGSYTGGRYASTAESGTLRFNERPGLFLHELGHRMESMIDALVEAERDFYKFRTEGEELERLRDIRPGSSYRADEMARKDRFIDPYMGKDYGGQNFELFTMAIERAFGGRGGLSLGLRDFARKDAEMLDWLLGVLASI